MCCLLLSSFVVFFNEKAPNILYLLRIKIAKDLCQFYFLFPRLLDDRNYRAVWVLEYTVPFLNRLYLDKKFASDPSLFSCFISFEVDHQIQ